MNDRLDNIIKYIKEDTAKKIEEIRDKNDKECKKIISNAKTRAAKSYKEINIKILEREAEIKIQTEMRKKIMEDSFILQKKNTLVDKTIKMSVEKFCRGDKKDYIDYLKKKIKKIVPSCEFSYELIFGYKDFETLPLEFMNECYDYFNLKSRIKCSNSFRHGFKLVCENFIINQDIETIILENENRLKNIVANSLFSGGI